MRCEECGGKMLPPEDCPLCMGEDPWGEPFCPNCDTCCGC